MTRHVTHRFGRPPENRQRRLGEAGEACAAAYLQQRGYRILARNERSGGVEIDLVACKGRRCVFVEVKTRSARRFGLPEESVDARKRARLVRGAAAWLREHRSTWALVRFDVICVEPGPDGALQPRHIPGAFDAGDV